MRASSSGRRSATRSRSPPTVKPSISSGRILSSSFRSPPMFRSLAIEVSHASARVVSLPVVTRGVGLLWHQYVEGVGGHGEVLRGHGHHFPVYIDRELRVGLDLDTRGPEVVDAFHPDEVAALEVPGDPDEVPPPAEIYGVDVEGPVVYTRFGGDDHTPAVESPVADGDLQETVVLDGLVVTVGEGQPGGEGFVPQERLDRSRGISQRTRAPFQPRGEGPRGLHAEPDGGDVHVVVVAGETEIYVDNLAFRYRPASTLDVLRYPEGPGKVIGRTEGQEAQKRVVVRQEVDHGAHGPVAAAKDEEPVSRAVVENLTHRLGEPCRISYGVGYAKGDTELLKAVEGLEERPLPGARTRVDDQGRTLGRDVTAHALLRTGGHRAASALHISCSWYSLVTMTKRVYESRAQRVSPDGDSNEGSGRPLHLLRFVVFSGAVGGQDDLERPQAVEPARARWFAFGRAAQEVCQHQRVHVLTHV